MQRAAQLLDWDPELSCSASSWSAALVVPVSPHLFEGCKAKQA